MYKKYIFILSGMVIEENKNSGGKNEEKKYERIVERNNNII